VAISKYLPAIPPRQAAPELQRYLDEELHNISERLNDNTVLMLETLASEPAKPENGMIVYADGTDWNPGSGEGFYGYQAGSWVKL